jgi:hypothetical protein
MRFGDYLQEKLDMSWITDNIMGKTYKGQKIINAVYDDKEGKMIRFWTKDKGKTKEFRPIPKDELIKVLK